MVEIVCQSSQKSIYFRIKSMTKCPQNGYIEYEVNYGQQTLILYGVVVVLKKCSIFQNAQKGMLVLINSMTKWR
jgi:hypothetical protein